MDFYVYSFVHLNFYKGAAPKELHKIILYQQQSFLKDKENLIQKCGFIEI